MGVTVSVQANPDADCGGESRGKAEFNVQQEKVQVKGGGGRAGGKPGLWRGRGGGGRLEGKQADGGDQREDRELGSRLELERGGEETQGRRHTGEDCGQRQTELNMKLFRKHW